MLDVTDPRQLLEMAEHAARAGDFTSADQLLSEVARLQEAEGGPNHPDLAKTLTNRAIVAEKTGRTSDAEMLYRRAAMVAAASLPSDHPIVVESRKNLADFCGEHGLAIAETVAVTESEGKGKGGDAPPQSPTRSSVAPVWVAIVVGVLILAGAVLVYRPAPGSKTPTAAPDSPRAADPPQPAAIVPPPAESAPPAPARPGDNDVRAPATSEGSASPTSVEVVTAQLCQTFSISGSRWQCDPRGDEVAPGPLVLYTRVRSANDSTIQHRWYRGDTLRQAVTLNVRANAAEGYRTYSRQTVTGPGDWRVEIRNARGDVLHAERFTVR